MKQKCRKLLNPYLHSYLLTCLSPYVLTCLSSCLLMCLSPYLHSYLPHSYLLVWNRMMKRLRQSGYVCFILPSKDKNWPQTQVPFLGASDIVSHTLRQFLRNSAYLFCCVCSQHVVGDSFVLFCSVNMLTILCCQHVLVTHLFCLVLLTCIIDSFVLFFYCKHAIDDSFVLFCDFRIALMTHLFCVFFCFQYGIDNSFVLFCAFDVPQVMLNEYFALFLTSMPTRMQKR